MPNFTVATISASVGSSCDLGLPLICNIGSVIVILPPEGECLPDRPHASRLDLLSRARHAFLPRKFAGTFIRESILC
jgi:hypothetical protein